MRSFASVAVTLDGTEHGRFEAVLESLPGTAPDARTLSWFETQPGAWESATTDPESVPVVLARYIRWLRALPWPRTFTAFPMSLDGLWMDYYLRRFTRYGVRQGHQGHRRHSRLREPSGRPRRSRRIAPRYGRAPTRLTYLRHGETYDVPPAVTSYGRGPVSRQPRFS